ncbi:MAG TPA: hypothetical protein VIC54_12015 [Terriglobales bacterium]|jgi:TolB-like protein
MNGIPKAAILRQLDRVLDSFAFRGKTSLRDFLSFSVRETIAGRADDLKEFTIALKVFGREGSFDPATCPIVRVQAGRLRATLARYYQGEGQDDDILIELPRGHYSACVSRRSTSLPVVVVAPFSNQSPRRSLAGFRQCLQQEIVHALAQLRSYRIVVPWAADDGLATALLAFAAARGQATVVWGSMRKFGHRIRLTCQLIDTASGTCLWSGSLERTDSHALELQAEMVTAILRQLRPNRPALPGRTIVAFPPARARRVRARALALAHKEMTS